jgi:hypothetical protein
MVFPPAAAVEPAADFLPLATARISSIERFAGIL